MVISLVVIILPFGHIRYAAALGQFAPQIAAYGTNVFVVWPDNTPRNNDIFFRASTDNGSTFGSTINLSNNSKSSLGSQVAAQGTNVYVAWQDDAGIEDVLFRASTDNGSTFSSVTNLSSTSGSSIGPQLASYGTNAYVIWQDNTVREYVLFRASVSSGSTFAGTVNISNNPPVSNASIDQTVFEGVLVTLDGTASSDPDNDPITYSWTQLAGTTVTLSDATSATPTFTAPEVGAAEILTFQLTVDDGITTSTDTVDVTVNDVSSNNPGNLATFTDSTDSGTLSTDCNAPTTITSLPTSYSAGSNLIIASVQLTSTDDGNELITNGRLQLVEGGTTLASNQYTIKVGGPGTHSSYVLLAKQINAPADPTYSVIACASATAVSAEAKIVVLHDISNSAHVDGVSKKFNTTESTLASLAMPSGRNVILASVQIDNGSTNQTIAANSIKITKGTTVLASNEFEIGLSSGSPSDIQSILLMAVDEAASISTYAVNITGANDDSLNKAEVKILALQTLGSEIVDAGDAGTIPTASAGKVLATLNTSFPSSSEVVVIATGQFNDVDTGFEKINTADYRLREAGTSKSANEFAMRGFFGVATDPYYGFTHTLIWRTESSLANATYDLLARATAIDLHGEVKIVALRLR
jgi:hypothetical protein